MLSESTMGSVTLGAQFSTDFYDGLWKNRRKLVYDAIPSPLISLMKLL